MTNKIGAVLVLLALGVAPAIAEDVKWYSGYSCKAGSQEPGDPAPYFSHGTAWNKAYETLRLACPIVRDAGGIQGGNISFVDQNPTKISLATSP